MRPRADAAGLAGGVVRRFEPPGTRPGENTGGGLAAATATEGEGRTEQALDAIRILISSEHGIAPGAEASRQVERQTGRPVGATRVHRGPEVDRIATVLGTPGMSVGSHVLLGRGAGEEVLRHELAHAAQNRGGAPDMGRPLRLGARGTPAEREAARVAGTATAGPVTPSTEQQVVRRWEDADLAAMEEWRAKQREAELAEQRRTQAWKALVERQREANQARQATSLAEDIERGGIAVFAAQAVAVQAVKDRLPGQLGEDWAAARQAIELLPVAVQSGAVAPQVAEEVRPAVDRFLWGMLSFALERDEEADLMYEFQRGMAESGQRREAELWQQCPKAMCHAGPREALTGGLYQMPPDPPVHEAPPIRGYLERVQTASSAPQWQQVFDDFGLASALLHKAVKDMLPADSPERQAVEQAEGQLTRQKELSEQHPEAVKIPAVFYPRNQVGTRKTAEGVEEQYAQGFPWFFYLYRERGTWVLMDATTRKFVNRREPSMQSSLEEHFRQQQGLPVVDPPLDLFDQLNAKLRFPKGMLYLTLPSGRTHTLETTEPTSWSEFLGRLGIAAVAIGLVLLTAGYGTPAAIAIVASAGLGAMSTYAGLQEKELHGMATDRDRRNAAILIAADIASVLSLGLGRIASSARMVTALGRAGSLAGRLWAPVTAASFMLDGAGLYVMTEEFVDQYRALDAQPGLTDEQRADTRRRLVLGAMITGGLAIVSLRGTGIDLRKGLGLPLHLDATPEGFHPRPDSPAVRAGTAPPAPLPEPAGARRWRAPEVRVREPDEALGAGDIFIEVRRSDGLVADIEVRPGPAPRDPARRARWEQDLQLHKEIAETLRGYGGLQGRIREIFAKIAELLTGRTRPPLELEFELYKLERSIDNRMRLLERRRLTREVQREIEDEIARIRTHLDEFEALLARPGAAARLVGPGRIAVHGSPAGFPPAPPGHVYSRAADGRWALNLEVPGKGPKFDVEYDAAGRPTGRVTNTQQLQESGVLGKSINDPPTKEQLRALGYRPDEPDRRISRPPEHSGGENRPFMEPLTLVDGKVEVSVRESFQEAQERLKSRLTQGQKTSLGQVRSAAGKNEVILLRGMFDTRATWGEVLRDRHTELRALLVNGGVDATTANRYVDALMKKTETIRVVLGTEPLRRIDYRGLHEARGGTLALGRPVHHFDPLYLGGHHRDLLDLPQAVHDDLHRFFDTLVLPSTSALPGARLQPTELQRSVPQWKAAAATLYPKGHVREGEVDYDFL